MVSNFFLRLPFLVMRFPEQKRQRTSKAPTMFFIFYVTDLGGKGHGYGMEMPRIWESRICEGNEWFWVMGKGFWLLGSWEFAREMDVLVGGGRFFAVRLTWFLIEFLRCNLFIFQSKLPGRQMDLANLVVQRPLYQTRY